MLAAVNLDSILHAGAERLRSWLGEIDPLTAVLAVLLLIALWGWWRARSRWSRASRGRNRRAQKAETEAERLLESLGFTILDRQLSRSWTLEVDGEPRAVSSRADLVVERDRRLFVADVKSGDLAPDPALPATRRQLLEYLLAFDVDGALIVDMRRRQVRSVSFPGLFGDGDS
jgi:membrane protein implicated in regulation of membrane protease activity